MARTVEMQDITVFSDQDYARIKMLQENLLIQVEEFDGRALRSGDKANRGTRGSYWKIRGLYGNRLLSAVNPEVSGDRLKQVAPFNDAF